MSSVKEGIVFSVLVCVERDGNEYHAFCPHLKGLHTAGKTKREAFSNARDAAEAYLHSLVKHGDPIPIGVEELSWPQEHVKATACAPGGYKDLVEIYLS